jgi:signal peptidase I
MEASFFQRHPRMRDTLHFGIFVICVIIGTVLINTFIFRSFNVSGHSMEKTLQDGDRLIVNRIPVTIAEIQNKKYTPDRGQIIVFKNPRFVDGMQDAYLVKRVIAFAGERVVVRDGTLTVFNDTYPNGHVYDTDWQKNNVGPQSPSAGDQDITVPGDTVFVAGDNRIGGNSYDSRVGLGTIPLFDIVGPVGVRVFPFNKISIF